MWRRASRLRSQTIRASFGEAHRSALGAKVAALRDGFRSAKSAASQARDGRSDAENVRAWRSEWRRVLMLDAGHVDGGRRECGAGGRDRDRDVDGPRRVNARAGQPCRADGVIVRAGAGLMQRAFRWTIARAVEAADVRDDRRGGDDKGDDPQQRSRHLSPKSTPGASLKSGSRARFTARIASTPSRP